jgi:hypothetical protein
MNCRYNVYHEGRLIAVIHAQNETEAVESACRKTTRHLPAKCDAVAVIRHEKRSPGWNSHNEVFGQSAICRE